MLSPFAEYALQNPASTPNVQVGRSRTKADLSDSRKMGLTSGGSEIARKSHEPKRPCEGGLTVRLVTRLGYCVSVIYFVNFDN